jgi:hypothetical protein
MNPPDSTRPNFDAIYFDTNILLGTGWPNPSVVFHNVCILAINWGIPTFIPQPVIKEAEEHWLRGVREEMSRVNSAVKDLQRKAAPALCDAKVEFPSVETLRGQYTDRRDEAIARYHLTISPYTQCSIEEVFHHATKYVMPFEYDKEGKGFQDAVILLSILDDLDKTPDARAVLVTKDNGFKKSSCKDFVPSFDENRLRVADLDAVWGELFHPYFNQTVVKPWEEERKNALDAAKANEPELKSFLSTHLTESMLRSRSFATVVKLMSVDAVQVNSVDTPIPEMNKNPDRRVEFTIVVSADCSTLAKKNSALWSLLVSDTQPQPDPPDEPEVEEKASWSGGIRAVADVVNRSFQNITPQSLVSDEELRNKR